MIIPDIKDSKYNHGSVPEIIMTCQIPIEVAFKPEDIVKVLKACASDSMAKVINAIGEQFTKDEMAESYAVDDLTHKGKEFIRDMFYFIEARKQPND